LEPDSKVEIRHAASWNQYERISVEKNKFHSAASHFAGIGSLAEKDFSFAENFQPFRN
jgi:hypothetical protein